MLDYPYYDEEFYEDDYEEEYAADEIAFEADGYDDVYEPYRPDIGWLVGLLSLLVLLFVFARGGPTTTWARSESPAAGGIAEAALFPDEKAETIPVRQNEPRAFAAPYADYVLTQGPHGQSYGHLAIDIAAGKGAAILSPINGAVMEKYTDQWGNPTLIIENEIYQVKMLHGIYSADVGEQVEIGQQVGVESNLGYTTDMRGVLCAGRTDYCGYHTHLNVYDKTARQNVNPLTLIGP